MRNLIICCLFLAACRPSGIIEIKNAGRDMQIDVATSATYPVMVRFEITGQVSDTFILNNYFVPGGNVDTTIISDWYDKTLSVDYKAYKATSGSLTIKYKL